jgi:hypothetical protein
MQALTRDRALNGTPQTTLQRPRASMNALQTTPLLCSLCLLLAACSSDGQSSESGTGGAAGGGGSAGTSGSSDVGGSGGGANGGSGGAAAGHAGSAGATAGSGGTSPGVSCGGATCGPNQYCRAGCSGTGGPPGDPSCWDLPPACINDPSCECICAPVTFFCTLPGTAIQCGCA